MNPITEKKVYDSKEDKLYIGVTSHYFKLSDANEIYRKSIKDEGKDDTILIQIAKDKTNEVNSIVTIGVEEGERLALALLNICYAIKDY